MKTEIKTRVSKISKYVEHNMSEQNIAISAKAYQSIHSMERGMIIFKAQLFIKKYANK